MPTSSSGLALDMPAVSHSDPKRPTADRAHRTDPTPTTSSSSRARDGVPAARTRRTHHNATSSKRHRLEIRHSRDREPSHNARGASSDRPQWACSGALISPWPRRSDRQHSTARLRAHVGPRPGRSVVNSISPASFADALRIIGCLAVSRCSSVLRPGFRVCWFWAADPATATRDYRVDSEGVLARSLLSVCASEFGQNLLAGVGGRVSFRAPRRRRRSARFQATLGRFATAPSRVSCRRGGHVQASPVPRRVATCWRRSRCRSIGSLPQSVLAIGHLTYSRLKQVAIGLAGPVHARFCEPPVIASSVTHGTSVRRRTPLAQFSSWGS